MTDLRTPRSRAILIGPSKYESDNLDDVPAIANTLFKLREALIEQCGMKSEDITFLLDPQEAHKVGSILAEEAQRTRGVLFVYYVGHGLVGPQGELYLAVQKTRKTPRGQLDYTAISYDVIHRDLGNTSAQAIIVILDCCFSGQALNRGLGPPIGLEGGVVITSAAEEERALAPRGEPFTTFTGQMLTLLAKGNPTGPEQLTLHDAYRYLRETLGVRGLPLPRWANIGDAGDIVLTANRARNLGLPPIPPPHRLRKYHVLAGATAVLVTAALIVYLTWNTFRHGSIPDPPKVSPAPVACTSGTLQIVGSTSFSPIASAAAMAYEEKCKKERFNVTFKVNPNSDITNWDSAYGVSYLSREQAENPALANDTIAMYDGPGAQGDPSEPALVPDPNPVGAVIYSIVANSNLASSSNIIHSLSISINNLKAIFTPHDDGSSVVAVPSMVAVQRLQGTGIMNSLFMNVFSDRGEPTLSSIGRSGCGAASGRADTTPMCTEGNTPDLLEFVNETPRVIHRARMLCEVYFSLRRVAIKG